MDLTFGEQVKIILGRKGMTIKELAESIEERTGKKMSRQNLTQRLGRDNFQEQDMRMIAGILGCPFHLNILDDSMVHETDSAQNEEEYNIEEQAVFETEETGAISTEEDFDEPEDSVEEILAEIESFESEEPKKNFAKTGAFKGTGTEKKLRGWRSYLQKFTKKTAGDDEKELSVDEVPTDIVYSEENEEFIEEADGEMPAEEEPAADPMMEQIAEQIEKAILKKAEEEPEDTSIGDINPYTGHEYKSNSVRMHPKRIGYVQVYDRGEHKWTEMTEWAFLGYQERKKALLGKDYEPPTYLD